MNEQAILELMRAYFPPEQTAGDLESFAEKFPRSLIKESLDVVNFLIYIEDNTGCHIDITEVGTAMLDHNFRQLAAQLKSRVNA